MTQASNPDDFDLRLKGITGAADRWGEEGDGDAEEVPERSDEGKDISGFSRF